MLEAPSTEIAENDDLKAESAQNVQISELNVQKSKLNVHESDAPVSEQVEAPAPAAPAFPGDELLARLIYAEANNQSEYGRRLVADVALNRVDHPAFADTLSGVIYEKNQFTVVNNGALDRAVVTEDNLRIAREEMASRTNSEVMFFTSEGYSAYGTPWKQIQDHYFSTWR